METYYEKYSEEAWRQHTMLKSRDILYSSGHNDECYTPSYVVIPIIKYLPKDKIIWCPFDTDESEFTKQLSLAEYKIVNSHICNGQDYYTYEPVSWDVMVSNPPYTNKRKIFERALRNRTNSLQ